MAITLADFNKIWASTSPLTPYSFSESNYKQGWNFVGSTPPARQMWDYLQKNNDEKMQYLANNYLPLSGGTMTGSITMPVDSNYSAVKNVGTTGRVTIAGGTAYNTGAFIWLYGKDHTQAGAFDIDANDGSTYTRLHGATDGTLAWNDDNIATAHKLPLLTDDLATTIPSGADLNDYKTAGTYISTSESITLSLSNCPVTQGAFKMIVNYLGYGNVSWGGRQIIFARNDIFVRVWNNPVATGSWGAWKHIAYAEDVLPLSGGTLTGHLKLENNIISEQITTLEKGTNPSATTYPLWFCAYDKNGTSDTNRICGIGGVVGANGTVEMGLNAYKWSTTESSVSVYISNSLTDTPCFRPSADNDINLGRAATRWKQLYAGTTTISTSDERLKDNIAPIDDEVLDAWGEVGWYQYQFKDSIAEKGENARIHMGAIAQRIESVFESHNLDANRYGLLCYDKWDATPAQKDEDGNIITPAQPAGNRYSLRYEEALCMEASYQRRRADRLEARIEALEKLLKK